MFPEAIIPLSCFGSHPNVLCATIKIPLWKMCGMFYNLHDYRDSFFDSSYNQRRTTLLYVDPLFCAL